MILLEEIKISIISQDTIADINYKLVGSKRVGDSYPITEFNTLITSKLRELGFNVTMGWNGNEYIPRGLAELDGDGPLHRNYGYHISW